MPGAPPRDAAQPMLAVRGVSVAYGSVVALRDVSLEVVSGEVVALLGANGAGKTTLLRAVSGLLALHRGAITAGTIELDGHPLTKHDPAWAVRHGLAQVMEGRRIFAELTVDENLRSGAFTRTDRAATRERYDHVLELFPVLAERRRVTAGFLSGGEQQMLAIGRALMAAPRLLLLDEPSLGLAPLIVEQIGEIIATVNREGVTVLLVEQNAAMALRLAHRGYVLETGRVVKHGSCGELLGDASIREFYLGVGEAGRRSFRELRAARRAGAVT